MDNLRDLVEKLAQHPRRWLIVTGVTLLTTVLAGIPQVDEYFAICEEAVRLEEELAESEVVVAELPRLEQTSADLRKQRDDLQTRMVTEENLAALRTRLVDIARETGCQVRRINFGDVRTRPWRTGDDPLAETLNLKSDTTPAPFHFETRPVMLSITGPASAIDALLSRMESDGKLSHPRLLELRPEGNRGSMVQLELEIWYFALTEPKAAA